MPTAIDLIRIRRRKRLERARLQLWVVLALVVAAAVSLTAGLAAVVGTVVLGDLRQGLPPPGQIEAAFEPANGGAARSTLLLDRSGQVVLLEAASPSSASRRGLSLDGLSTDRVPASLVQATVAYVDPGFWRHKGYTNAWLWDVVAAGLRGQAPPEGSTVTQRLVRYALQPAADAWLPPAQRAIREALLAAQLTDAYGRDQILEWYLNSAYYGNWAYGADSAALVYFGKHAARLDLAESAMLAAIPLDPTLNPIDAPQQAKAGQAHVLEAMVSAGLVSQDQAQAALSQSLEVQTAAPDPPMRAAEFTAAAWQEMEALYGRDFIRRSGLRVITTLDYDLQLQAECVARTQLARLSEGTPAAVVNATDGSPCVAAGFLPPLRPGDVGVDHAVSAAAVVILDPTNGETLARVETSYDSQADIASIDPLRLPGPTLYPFVYLAGFARGYSAGTMVLDIPSVFRDAQDAIYTPADDDGIFHGPVLVREALANLYPVAAARMVDRVGVGEVLETAQQMGLRSVPVPSGQTSLRQLLEQTPVRLSDLVFAYGVIANRGTMAGISAGGTDSLAPSVVVRIVDADDQVLYSSQADGRPVLSPPLAYVLEDILSDEAARWPAYGQPNPLEVGRPAGAISGVTGDQTSGWAVFTPSRVVGVWMGNAGGRPMRDVRATNGPAAIWNAVLRYATRDLPRDGWQAPAGVSEVEICDPSGLLPTEYCPEVVREVFVQGTEPVYYDSLYRPFRVNRETGKLATLYTPLDLVEERVYLVPPPEAAAWAEQSGLEQPPSEYDTLYEPPFDPLVNIDAPAPFSVVSGQVVVQGEARPEGLSYFRLQYGQGLNPTSWIQVGEDRTRPVANGALGTWDTSGLAGLYTLQLLAVHQEGRVTTAAVQLTIDNQPPTLRLVLPEDGQVFSQGTATEAILQAEVADDLAVARVEFFVDNRLLATLEAAPYSVRWRLGRVGTHQVMGRAYDTAGNSVETPPVALEVVR
jgi:membrane carboxypeptidase/penicillin-binding protein